MNITSQDYPNDLVIESDTHSQLFKHKEWTFASIANEGLVKTSLIDQS